MAKLLIHHDKVSNIGELIEICPFGAIEEINGRVQINGACKMCKLCVNKGPSGAIEYIEEEIDEVDKSLWRGIAVYVEHKDGVIHPITYELIGKAKEIAIKIDHPVYAIMIGNHISNQSHVILHYGVNKVFVYNNEKLNHFRIEPYTTVFHDFVQNIKPTVILLGATPIGRQLAPRLAARLRTGLTADCTKLNINENTDLVQIRPAFGGNIMAQILTPNHRPQMATVRYKVMDAPERNEIESGEIIECLISPSELECKTQILKIIEKEKEKLIESADVLVVAGRGIKQSKDLHMLKELADLLGGQLACTRPLAEANWLEAKCQVGLSGRTVRPKLIITCGVSGSVQFVAGMNKSDHIIAINNDENAPIFKVANYCLTGDLYEIIPNLIDKIKRNKEE